MKIRFVRIGVNLVSGIVISIGVLGILPFGTAHSQDNVLYSDITVQMYALTSHGGNTGSLCVLDDPNTPDIDETDKRYGCTAFVDDETHTYPYTTNPVTVNIERGYLLDVVTQEMGAAAPLAALQAQAVAARTKGEYHNNNVNNSSQYQVFVPYRFELLQPTVAPSNEENPCASDNLNEPQTQVCAAVDSTTGQLLIQGEAGVIDSEYRAENGDPTNPCQRGMGQNCPIPPDPCPGLALPWFTEEQYPYLVGVDDPLSAGQSRSQADCNSSGMGQNGARRWAWGTTNPDGTGTPWSVQWDDYRQILVHYYTGIHLRDTEGSVFTPDDRWNLLEHTIPATMLAGEVSLATVRVQNTSTEDWYDNVVLGWQWTEPEATPDPWGEWAGGLPLEVTQGASIMSTVAITAPEAGGTYALHLDVGRTGSPAAAEQPGGQQKAAVTADWFYLGGWPHAVIAVSVAGATATPTPIPTSIPTPTSPPPPIPTPTPTPTSECRFSTAAASQRSSGWLERAHLLYRVRDEVLSQTVAGRRYVDLYYTHSTEIARLLLADRQLDAQGLTTLDLFVPLLQAPLDGRGDSVTITAEQVKQVELFLDALSAAGSPALQQAIAGERARRPLAPLAGMTFAQAWGYLNGYALTWLPPVSTAHPYRVQVGRTIAVQFTLTDFEDDFVTDNTVALQVLDTAGNVVVGPVGLANNPTPGLVIRGKKYHYNLRTANLPPGNYRLVVDYNALVPGQVALWDLELTTR